ncbi:LysE family translocator [bacterium]|nr:LysE family translocator [bacterium]
MNVEQILAIVIFAFVSSITPGPNNLMVLASATNFGFKKTIPHILGISLGFAFMLMMLGLGLSLVFKSYPIIETILKVCCVLFLFFLAYKIATSSSIEKGKRSKTPISFIEAALFQWVNPKAWAMALTAVSLFSPNATFKAVIVMVMVFTFVNIPCVSTWSFAGSKLGNFLKDPKKLKYFNYIMAGLLVGCLGFLL